METKNAIMMRLLDYLIEVYETNENLSIDEAIREKADIYKNNGCKRESMDKPQLQQRKLYCPKHICRKQ